MFIFLFMLLAIATNEVKSFGRRVTYDPTTNEKKISSCTTSTTTTSSPITIITTTTTDPIGNHDINSDIKKKKLYNNENYDNHQLYHDCGIGGFGIVQKIPYHDQTLNTMDVPFSSACIRCGLCLVIADKINKTLMDVHDVMSPDRLLNYTEVDVILKMICDDSFLRYRLREIDKERYIGESLPDSIIVESTANDLWAIKLKIKCNDLIEGITTIKLYKQWQECRDNSSLHKNLATILCNGDIGILRDCRSIADPEYYPQTEGSFYAGVKVKAAFHCI